MKKIFFVLSAAIFFASCKKNSSADIDLGNGVTKKLMKATYVYDTDAPENTSYTYDDKGRLSAITDDNRTETFSYTSVTSLLVTARKNSDNSLVNTKECAINEKGNITEIIIKNEAGVQTDVYKYTYNAEGYIIRFQATGTSGGYEMEYTIADGNVVSSNLSYGGVFSSVRKYSFDKTKLNKSIFYHVSYWSELKMFGKTSKNMVEELKIFNASGALTWHTKHSYDMDANGYPAKVTNNYLLDSKQGFETYVYQ